MASYDPLRDKHPGCRQEHPPSYWVETGGPEPSSEGQVKGDIDTTVAVIGGGYTGLSAAYHLAKVGIDVVVLEANRVGWGASGRNGGFARPAIGRLQPQDMIDKWGQQEAIAFFSKAREALHSLKSFIREERIDCDIREEGYLRVAHRPEKMDELAQDARVLREKFEYPIELIDKDMLQNNYVGGTEAFGALRYPDCVPLHPLKLARGIATRGQELGVRIFVDSPVLGWSKNGEGNHVLSTHSGTVKARTVVVATNGYTSDFFSSSLRGRLLPVLSHIVVTRPLAEQELEKSSLRTTQALSDTRASLHYYRLLPDNRLLFGGRGAIRDTDASGRKQVKRLRKVLEIKFPALQGVDIEHSWNGWICVTYDQLPHVGVMKDDKTVYFGLGYMGSGVSFSFFTGKNIAQMISEDKVEMGLTGVREPLRRFPFPVLRRFGLRCMYLSMKVKR